MGIAASGYQKLVPSRNICVKPELFFSRCYARDRIMQINAVIALGTAAAYFQFAIRKVVDSASTQRNIGGKHHEVIDVNGCIVSICNADAVQSCMGKSWVECFL